MSGVRQGWGTAPQANARGSTRWAIRVLVFCVIVMGSAALRMTNLQAQPLPPVEPQHSPATLNVGIPQENAFSAEPPPFVGSGQADPLVNSVYPTDPSAYWHWILLPQGFLYRTYWASTQEPRLSTRAIRDSSRNFLDSQIGGRFGIVRFGDPDREEGFQVDLLGGANLRQNIDTEGWDMTGTDYRFDVPLTWRRGPHAWKFGYYHVSSHMGDEFLQANPAVTRIDYFRDCTYLGYSYHVRPTLRVYGEVEYAFSRDFAEPWHLQFGFDWGPVEPTGLRGAPFFAINGNLREELDFSGNVSLQAGWAWKGRGRTAGTLRTGPHYYNGGSPQFSFYQENEQQIGWGLWYDY